MCHEQGDQEADRPPCVLTDSLPDSVTVANGLRFARRKLVDRLSRLVPFLTTLRADAALAATIGTIYELEAAGVAELRVLVPDVAAQVAHAERWLPCRGCA